MKNICLWAAVLAIAFIVASVNGLFIIYIGIIALFVIEVVKFDAGGLLEPVKTYEKRLKCSRKMLLCHASWYVCTLMLAAAFDMIDGYTYYVEEAVGNTYRYNPEFQSGDGWYWLFALLIFRGVLQIIFEQHIKENIERSKNLPA